MSEGHLHLRVSSTVLERLDRIKNTARLPGGTPVRMTRHSLALCLLERALAEFEKDQEEAHDLAQG